MAQTTTRPGAESIAAHPVQPPQIVQATAPIVTGIAPSQGEAGDSFDLIGSGLSAVSQVRFQNAAGTQFGAMMTGQTDTNVRATVPQVPAATYRVGAFDVNGVPIEDPQTYTVVAGMPKPPAFDPNDPFDPASGEPGVTVTIHGMHLNQVTDVEFHGGARGKQLQHPNNKTLTVKVPKAATTGRIRLIAPTGTVKSPKDFIVT